MNDWQKATSIHLAVWGPPRCGSAGRGVALPGSWNLGLYPAPLTPMWITHGVFYPRSLSPCHRGCFRAIFTENQAPHGHFNIGS